MKYDIGEFNWNCVPFLLKSDKNKDTLGEDLCMFQSADIQN